MFYIHIKFQKGEGIVMKAYIMHTLVEKVAIVVTCTYEAEYNQYF